MPGWRTGRWSPKSSREPGWAHCQGSWQQRLLIGLWAEPVACSGRAGLGHRFGGASPSPCAGRRSRSTGRCCSRCMSRSLCDRSSSNSARPKTPHLKMGLVSKSCRMVLTQQLWRGLFIALWPRFSNIKMSKPLIPSISQPFAKGTNPYSSVLPKTAFQTAPVISSPLDPPKCREETAGKD